MLTRQRSTQHPQPETRNPTPHWERLTGVLDRARTWNGTRLVGNTRAQAPDSLGANPNFSLWPRIWSAPSQVPLIFPCKICTHPTHLLKPQLKVATPFHRSLEDLWTIRLRVLNPNVFSVRSLAGGATSVHIRGAVPGPCDPPGIYRRGPSQSYVLTRDSS